MPLQNGFSITPHLQVDTIYLDTGRYTESGAGGLGLTVESDEYYQFKPGAGADLNWSRKRRDGSIVEARLRGSLHYDLADDRVQNTSQFTGGGAAFTTEGADAGDLSGRIGGRATLYTTGNMEFTANYDYEIGDKFNSHNVFVRAAYKF